jgi:transposase-like protein
MDKLSADHFRDDEAACKELERILWPNGPVCPHCGVVDGRVYPLKRAGLYRCGEKLCRKDFTVTTKTIMERSHIALHKWLQAFHLLTASKKGISAHQLHRMLDIGYEAAWFMAHRIREAMRAGSLAIPPEPLGGKGRIVEADETYFGKEEVQRPRNKYLPPPTKGGRSGPRGKRAVVALVERGGKVRTFHPAVADKASVARIISENVAMESTLHTDESRLYWEIGLKMRAHEAVKHSAGEYVRDDVHTNTAEGYFSIFKRGMRGIYQHCAEKHLHRYLAEYDFRFNHRIRLGFDDADRAEAAIKGAEGKRLYYRQPH